MVFRIWLFGIHGEVLNFRNWTLCYHELFRINRKKQNNEFIDGSVTFMNLWTLWILNHGFYGFIGLDLDLTMDLLIFDDKSIFKLWTLNYVDCIPFSCIDSFHMAHNQANSFRKVLFSNYRKIWSNLHLYRRSVMYFSPDLRSRIS